MGARPLAIASAALAAGVWVGVSVDKVGKSWAAALVAWAAAALLGLVARRPLASTASASRLARLARALRPTLRGLAVLLGVLGVGLSRGAVAPRAVLDAPLVAWLEDPGPAHGGREPIELEGRVEETAFAPEGARLVLAIERRETAPGSPLEAAPHGLRAVLSGPRALHRGNRVRALARLHLPEPQRNPGGRDLRRELARRGITLSGALDPHGLVFLERGPAVFRAIDELRDRFSQRCQELCTTPQRGALVAALAVGDRAGLDLETEEELVDSGLVHLLSSAGLHLALVALLSVGLLRALLLRLASTRRFRPGRWPRSSRSRWCSPRCSCSARAGRRCARAQRPRWRSLRRCCRGASTRLTGLLLGLALCALWIRPP